MMNDGASSRMMERSNSCSTTADSTMSATFDSKSYVVIRKETARRRRTGSFGEAQPELMSAVSNSSEWDFEANFEDPVPQNAGIVMTEQYSSCVANQQRRLTSKDFMDGSSFMNSSNLFRDSRTSQRWNSDIMERPSHSFETQPDQFHSDGIEKLIQQLRVTLNDENAKPRRSANPASPYKEEDHGTEPTTPNTEPTTTPPSSLPSSKEKKDKKKHKSKKERTKKSKRRHSRLPSVVPPDEIHVSDNVTVASSVGGLTTFKCQEKIRNLLDKGRYDVDDALPTQALNKRPETPREVDISAPMTVASSVGQDSGWVMKCHKPKPRKSPREVDISAPMTVQSSLGGEESLFHRTSTKPLNLERVKSPVEIDATDHTVVSSLGESQGDRRGYKPLLADLRQQDAYRGTSLHHQLYRSNSRDY